MTVSLANSSLFAKWPKALLAVDEHGTITHVNEKCIELLGWQEADLKGKNLHESVCSHALGYLHTADNCPLLKPDFYTSDSYNEYRWKMASGDLRAIYAKGILLHPEDIRLVVFSDESDTNYSQKDMQRLASFAEHSPTPIIEFDSSGSIEFTNPAMVDLMGELGFDDEGKPLILPPNLSAIIEQIIQENEPALNIEHTVETTTFIWDIYPVPSENSVLIQAYGRDVTAAKLLTESLQREKETAEAANRSKSHFLSVMSHELRTPMNSIIGFSRRLLTKGEKELSPLYVNALKTILDNARALLGTINETLDISKIEAGKMDVIITEITLRDLAAEIERLLKVQAEEKGLQLQFHISEDVPALIQSEREFLRKILINLIGNAIKFTDNGSINVAMRMGGDNQLLIAVKDEGIGISEKDQESIFERFTQASGETEKRYQGTGLGLNLCKELVQLLGGEIGVESAPGEGSLFWVSISTTLPLSE